MTNDQKIQIHNNMVLKHFQDIGSLTCLRCGYQWLPKTDKVKKCPYDNCKSEKWNVPRRVR